MSSFPVTDSLVNPPIPVLPVSPLPTKEAAEKIFWGLNDRFWMQMIDGKYHEYGPMVFDEGLHQGGKEAGFYQSLKAGCEFASAHLTERLTVDFYTGLHKQLCGHFKGKENNTGMTADSVGTLKTKRL